MPNFLPGLISGILEAASKFAAFFFVWRWAKDDTRADIAEGQNETLKANIGVSDDEFSRKLRERAAKKRKNRD